MSVSGGKTLISKKLCLSRNQLNPLLKKRDTKKDFLQEMRDEALKREVLSLLKEVFFFSLGSRDSRSFFLLLLRHHLLLPFKACVARHPQKTENALLIIPNYGLKYSPALITAFFSFFSLHRLLAVQAGKRRQRMRWNKNISNKQEREEVSERERSGQVFRKRKRNLLDVLLSHPSLSLLLLLCLLPIIILLLVLFFSFSLASYEKEQPKIVKLRERFSLLSLLEDGMRKITSN